MEKKRKHISVTELKTGQKARVVAIQGGWGFQRKLENIGIRVGSEISNLSGGENGPVVVRSGCTQVALGRGMARKIIVEQQ
ncbi:MAG: FeoA family protein [Elusimicrobiota bacterium]